MNDENSVPAKHRAPAPAPFGWLRSEIDRLFDDFSPARSMFNFGLSGIAPVPALELTASEREYRLTAELPGLKEEDVDVSVADGVLTLKGEKREEQEQKNEGYLLSERRYGSFERRVSLPSDVDPEKISAEFKKGVLTITLPKDEQASGRSRKISINSQG